MSRNKREGMYAGKVGKIGTNGKYRKVHTRSGLDGRYEPLQGKFYYSKVTA